MVDNSETPPPPPVGGGWKYKPPPAEPDPHDDSAATALACPEGFSLVGARVRGRKHKHDGTWCDDWFDAAAAGAWTVVAVADGAGSCRFSRVGARESTQAAVRYLSEQLEARVPPQRARWSPDDFRQDDATGAFADADLAWLQGRLYNAMIAAFSAVRAAAKLRADGPEHARVLGRPPEVADFSATLLLAIHAVVPTDDGPRSLALSCQAGDGMIAAVEAERWGLRLMGVPDGGEYGGETCFLTASRWWADPAAGKAEFHRRTHSFLGRLAALMVMTDGVSDDYFPADPGMLRLHADLALNGVLSPPAPAPDRVFAALRETPQQSPHGLLAEDFSYRSETAGPDGPVVRTVRDAGRLAERIGWDAATVFRSAEVIATAAAQGAIAEGPRQQRLAEWLDGYYVRGSSDDRTLVVLTPEARP